jgi:hypothetical protein
MCSFAVLLHFFLWSTPNHTHTHTAQPTKRDSRSIGRLDLQSLRSAVAERRSSITSAPNAPSGRLAGRRPSWTPLAAPTDTQLIGRRVSWVDTAPVRKPSLTGSGGLSSAHQDDLFQGPTNGARNSQEDHSWSSLGDSVSKDAGVHVSVADCLLQAEN